MCTSPPRVIAATNGGSTRSANRIILLIAFSSAEAMSAPDRFPETNTNSLTRCSAKASFSRSLYRIRLSAVRSTHSFSPTVGNQSWSGVPTGKWARWRSYLIERRDSTSRIAFELHKFSSRYRTKLSGGCGERSFPADRLFDLSFRATIFPCEIRNRFTGIKP